LAGQSAHVGLNNDIIFADATASSASLSHWFQITTLENAK